MGGVGRSRSSQTSTKGEQAMAESELQQGAQAERDAIRAWVRRSSHFDDWGVPCIYIDRLEKYLDGRAKRYNKRPGGLGTRKAK